MQTIYKTVYSLDKKKTNKKGATAEWVQNFRQIHQQFLDMIIFVFSHVKYRVNVLLAIIKHCKKYHFYLLEALFLVLGKSMRRYNWIRNTEV